MHLSTHHWMRPAPLETTLAPFKQGTVTAEFVVPEGREMEVLSDTFYTGLAAKTAEVILPLISNQ